MLNSCWRSKHFLGRIEDVKMIEHIKNYLNTLIILFLNFGPSSKVTAIYLLIVLQHKIEFITVHIAQSMKGKKYVLSQLIWES